MAFGAATLLARAHGAEIVDARKGAVGSIARVYAQYPHLDRVLPAMGYSPAQVHELEATIRASGAEIVLDGSPINLARLVRVPQPVVNVHYDYDDLEGRLGKVLKSFLASHPGR
jgi:predicted GTPase